MTNFVTADVNPLSSGIPQIDRQLVANAPNLRDNAERAAKEANRLREHISPQGTPPVPMTRLLDERRIKYLIPDEAFEYAAAFDRVLTWQVERHDDGKFGDSGLYMPDSTRDRLKDTACLGIVVGAGLSAMDHLKSHGIDLGHLVVHAKNVVFRCPIATIGGKDYHLTILTTGDIIASCDLALARKEKRVRVIEKKLEDGSVEHLHCDEDGKLWHPQSPSVES